jgi:hypothetical protein
MGLNNFIVLAPIPSGAQVGPLPSVDLWALAPPTGVDPGFCLICTGDFEGTVSVEGSLDNVKFNPIGNDSTGNPAGGFTLGPRGNLNTPPLELSPLVVNDVVRFVRPRVGVGTKIKSPVQISIGGALNCSC